MERYYCHFMHDYKKTKKTSRFTCSNPGECADHVGGTTPKHSRFTRQQPRWVCWPRRWPNIKHSRFACSNPGECVDHVGKHNTKHSRLAAATPEGALNFHWSRWWYFKIDRFIMWNMLDSKYVLCIGYAVYLPEAGWVLAPFSTAGMYFLITPFRYIPFFWG